MVLLHEKRAALPETALLAERNNRQATNPINSNTTRNPWSERYSIRLNPISVVAILLGHSAVVMSLFAAIVGGPNG